MFGRILRPFSFLPNRLPSLCRKQSALASFSPLSVTATRTGLSQSFLQSFSFADSTASSSFKVLPSRTFPKKISQVVVRDGTVKLSWTHDHSSKDQEKETGYGLYTLRDNCPCPSCLHPVTLQRLFDSSTISSHSSLHSASISNDGLKLIINWNNPASNPSPFSSSSSSSSDPTHKSEYPIEWLWRFSQDYKVRSQHPYGKPSPLNQLWKPVPGPSVDRPQLLLPQTNEIQNLPTVSYQQVMEGTTLGNWVEDLVRMGFLIIKDVPANYESNLECMRRFGTLRQSIYGDHWDIQVKTPEKPQTEEINTATFFEDDSSHSDTAYTNIPLCPHTDGTYFTDSPGVQFFRFVEHTGKGGETLLVDGFQIAQDFQTKRPDLFDFLTKRPLRFHYLEEGVRLQAEDFVFRLNPRTGELLQFRFNNDDRLAEHLKPEDEKLYYEAVGALIKAVQSKDYMLQVKLRPDELLLTLNWRVLHGRRGFSGHRRMWGAYISQELFLSSLHLARERYIPSASS